ncbi:hypothetical protein [Novosphingobium sp.]|uniref:hypothetical protein n=1 Tax=Novosphingobium sp. TaxID=1874826 RepID=UPI0031E1F0FA
MARGRVWGVAGARQRVKAGRKALAKPLAITRGQAHDARMTRPSSPLDDPATAVAIWARFRRLMRWMFLITLATVIGALTVLYRQEGRVSIHFYIAVAVGVSFAMLLTSGLMGLVFLSNASGHDAAVAKPDESEDDQSKP